MQEIFDFVVVGSGGGSMAAGLVMRSLGKSVLILEKADLVGGTTAKSGGVLWVPNNPFMKRDRVDDSFEAAVTYLDSLVPDGPDSPGTSPERRRAYVLEAQRMLDFLISQGVKFDRSAHWPDYYDEFPGGSGPGRAVVAELFDLNELGEWKAKVQPGMLDIPGMLDEFLDLATTAKIWSGQKVMLKLGLRMVAAKLAGKKWATAGAALQGRMLQAALNSGVEIRTKAPVSELIVEDGTTKGVVATIDGRPRKIGARLGVLVNAGGFAQNQEMRDRYQPGTSAAWSLTTPGDTGEMIQEMMRHGAEIGQMEEMVGFQLTLPPGTENDYVKPGMQRVTALPHSILVDRTGVRYVNEGGSYMAYCKAMLERNKAAPAVPSWAIMDGQFFRGYMFAGMMPSRKKMQRWVDQGYLRKADTVEGLARQLEIDPATLKATLDRFNGFVAKNHDDDFNRGDREYDRWLGDPNHRPSATLGTIEKAPFYAVPVYPGDVGTYGGVVTDVHARVLRADRSVIPGLYATGVSTASVMGRIYPGAGSSVGPSFVWGYVAAKHAANADNLAG